MSSLIISTVGLSTTCIVIFLLLCIPANKFNWNQYLYLLLSAQAIHLSGEFLLHIQWINSDVFSLIATAMVVIIGPSLYYYGRALYNLNLNTFWLQLIPLEFGILFLWLLYFTNVFLMPQWLLSAYYFGVLLFYFIAFLILTIKHTADNLNEWTKTIRMGFGILVFLHLLEVLLINSFSAHAFKIAIIATSTQNICTILFFLIVIYQILRKPEYFSNIKITLPTKKMEANFSQIELDLILNYVNDTKAYKQSKLRCQDISNTTGLNTKQVSEIINGYFKKNFNEWINDYRIEEAKTHLKNSSMNIQEIYFEVGFNSKSAFNTAFRKRLDLTPSQYREQYGSES